MGMDWTAEQAAAINFDDPENLLVSAAAGSGKTAVLTERVLQRALQDKVAPEELLVVTFTDKAAENMRSKIAEKLAEIADDPGDQKRSFGKNRSQLHALQQRFSLAQISTIHSFCLTLIRENLRDLTDESGKPLLEPGFLTIDQEMAQIYLNEAIDEVLDDYYTLYAAATETEEGQYFAETFHMLRAMFDRGQNDTVLRSSLLSTHAFLRSIAYYRDYIDREMEQLKADGDVAESETAQWFVSQFAHLVKKNYRPIMESFESPFYTDQVLTKKTKEVVALRAMLAYLEPLLQTVMATDRDDLTWDQIHDLSRDCPELKPLIAPRADAKPETRAAKEDYMALYEAHALPIIQMLTGQLNENQAAYKRYQLQHYPGVFTMSEAEFAAQNAQIYRVLTLYFKIFFEVDEVYQAKKRAVNQLDFSDYEHYALQLLSLPEIREQIAQQYREIYIDEYQDTSYVQEEIIRLIASRNRFMVGDIKQSIYRFRHAAPQLFEAKLDTYRAPDLPLSDGVAEEDRGHVILLNANFRSQPGVLDYINQLFFYLLTREVGDIDYDDTQKLIPGLAGEEGHDPAVRIALVDDLVLPKDATEAERSNYPEPIRLLGNKIRPDAEWIALDILETMHEQERAWSDFAILCPTHAECDMQEKILTHYGIPVDRYGERNFLDTRELRFLESVLRVFRNFKQDIPLAALMRSPLLEAPFREEELLLIANAFDDYYFHEKVRRYAAEKDDAPAQKLARFLATYDNLRELSRLLPLAEWLERLISYRDYRGYLASLPYAEERLDDVNQFIAWGEAFQKSGGSLNQFADYVYQIRQRGSEVEMIEVGGSDDNSVKIMTIHASKGLEFPIVYLADLERNLTDPATNGNLTLSLEGGISAYYTATKSDRVFNTPRNFLHEQRIKQKSYAEKIRLLYVAMTRAEQQLILVAGKPDDKKESALDDLPRSRHIAYSDLLALNNYRDWILAALRQTEPADYDKLMRNLSGTARLHDGEPYIDIAGREYFIEMRRLVETGVLYQAKSAEKQAERTLIIPSAIRSVNHIKDLIAIRDPEPLTEVPNKWTVSEWKRAQYQPEPSTGGAASSDGISLPGMRDMDFTLKQPEDKLTEALTGSAFGTLVHNLARFLPNDAAVTITSRTAYERYLDQLITTQKMLEAEREAALAAWPLIHKWIISDLFAKLAVSERAYHEIPFTLAVDPPGIPDSSIKTLVQGIIDLWFENDGEIYLIDFKSDRLGGDTAHKHAELMKRYGMQLQFYRIAIEKIMKRKVDHSFIWLFRDAEAVTIPEIPLD